MEFLLTLLQQTPEVIKDVPTANDTSDVMLRWGSLIISNLVILVGIVFTYLQTRNRVDGVAEQISNSPTANGFARETTDGIAEVVALVKILPGQITQINERQITGFEAMTKGLNGIDRRLTNLEERVSKHIDEHH